MEWIHAGADGPIARSAPHGQLPRLVVRHLLGAVFAGAALLKAASPLGVLLSIEHLLPIDREASYALLCALVAIELGLGIALLTDWRPRFVTPAATITIVALTLVLARMAIDPWAPSCSCLGELSLADDAQTANLLGLARNGLLLAGCAYLMRARPQQTDTCSARGASNPDRVPT